MECYYTSWCELLNNTTQEGLSNRLKSCMTQSFCANSGTNSTYLETISESEQGGEKTTYEKREITSQDFTFTLDAARLLKLHLFTTIRVY